MSSLTGKLLSPLGIFADVIKFALVDKMDKRHWARKSLGCRSGVMCI
jgi:hypothetical protein